jgi:hypothetical protein
MMQLAATKNGFSLQGPALPTLVGNNGFDLMGFDNFGSPTGALIGAGMGAVVLSSAVTFGLTWWAFKSSREGSNWKPAAIMAAPGLIFGLLAMGAVAGAAAP